MNFTSAIFLKYNSCSCLVALYLLFYHILFFLVPPMLWIPHQLVGAPLYYNVTLECFTEAHPTSLNYWTRDDGHMIHESPKYHMENTVGVPSYKTHMKLLIRHIITEDYGTYKCVAKNPRGESDGTIRLYSEYLQFYNLQLCCLEYAARSHVCQMGEIEITSLL